MIDLSYLTEEEQEMIMKVLKRDSDLKKSEDDRVQKLQKTEKDGNKLKYMTGEWFYEAKSKRHRDKIHGSDIIRASMRRKKPVTLYELSQSRGEKPSWVNTVNKDVFLPPELEGLIEQPEDEVPLESTLSNSVQAVADPQIDQPRQTSTSAGKERQNPFNDYSLADDMLTFPHEALPIENSLVLPETTPGELLSTPKSTVDSVRVSNTEIPVSSEERDAQVPVPKKRTIVPKQQDFVKENEKPLPRSQSKADQNGNLPKGILKRSSSSSSNDSEILRNNSSIQGPNSNRGFLKSNSIKTQSSMEKTEEGSQNSLDRKQVRFSPTVKQKEFPEKTQISDGKELGEHGLLESELDRSQMLSSVTLEQDERKSEEISGLLQTNDFSQSNTFTNNQTQSPHKNRQQENNEVTLPALGATRENSPATTEISQWIQSSNEYIDIPINGPHTKVLNTPGEENADQHEFYAEPKSSQVCSPPSANADKEDGKEKNVHNPPAVHVKTEKYHLPVVEGSSRIATYDDDSILLKPGNDYESVYLSKYHTYEGLGEPDIHLQSNESHYPQDVGGLQYFNENRGIKITVDSEEEKVEPETFVIGVKQLPEDDLVKLDKKNDNSDSTEFNNIETSSSLKSPGTLQTHNFKIQSMKERMQSGMKVPDSSNSQFQNLVMFWNTSPEKQKPVLKGDLPSADTVYQSEDIENPGPTSSSMVVWEKGELLHQQQLLPKDGKKIMNPNIFPKVLPTDASDIHLKSFQSSPPKSTDIKKFSNEEVVEVIERSTRIPSIDHETLNRGLEKMLSDITSGLSVEETQSKTPNAAPIVQRVSFVDRVKERSRQTDLHQPNEIYEDKPVNELLSNQMPIAKFSSPVEKKHEIDPMVKSSAEFTIRRPSVEEEYIIPARKKSNPIPLQSLAQSLSEKEIISLSAETSEIKMHEEDCLEDDRKTNSFARRTSVEEEYIIPEANKRDDISLHTLVQSLSEKEITFESSVTNEVEEMEKDLIKDQREVNSCVKGTSVEEEEYLIPKVKEYSASHHSIAQPLTEEEFTSPSTGISEVEAEKDLFINDEKESDSCERRMSVVEEDIVPEQKKSDKVDLQCLAQSLAEKNFTYAMSSEVESRNAVFNESIKLWNSSDNYAENTPVIEDDILPEARNNDFQPLYLLAQSLSEVSALYPSNSASSPQYNSDQSEDYTSLDPGKKNTTEERALYKPEDYDDEMDATLNSLRASTPVKIDKETSSESHEISQSGGPSKNLDDEDNEVPERRSLPDDSWSNTEQRRKSARFDEESNPIMMALRRSKNKPLASSKSLEDITAATSDERSFNNLRDDLVMSAEDDLQVESPQSPKDTISGFSTVPSSPVSMVSDPEKIKQMSKSVPAFLQQESDDRETDSTSESSFPVGRHKKTASSLTNLSSSSGMASLSSVSGSVMSVYSGDFGNVDVKGNIQFALDYVSKLKELHIFVVQCKDLAAAEPKKQRSDPYVKSYLLPDKAKMGKRKTSVKKKTLNPTFNEILRYKIDNDTLKTQTLNLSVWHNDTFGRNSFLGEVDVDLASWNWEDKQMNWFPLRPRTPSASQGLTYRGEMKVALRFDPQPSHGKKTSSTGEVYIWVKDCKNLPMLRSSGINSFVKCSVLPDTSRKSRQKTRIVKKSANPLFNHTMVYDGFRPDDLKEACVELTVWDHDKLVNHFLGGLRLGLGTGKSYGTAVDWMDSSADEATLWERMIDTPNEWVEDVLPLRMLTMAKMSGK
ncbi:synaptotagmin-like protein 2 isoform X1 [Erpetoichthys calabaricus]|uniref:Synaptotagmin-like protein 2 n=1 Tax=Erpetoichthys calabaricus TaxID=27687 RepID=A0A8C4S6I2_ERPCA|nr:synaptotagmin-like protein 2 isoform X1 [Erpetoichthys calabaricus]XP_051782897.1 synaptotagmin-like protein 2 isoform X1 [Erpetoichthys calabaricus]XP_051782898.1 synaptotagmin-like protein 2 isoform X1 [Erpetoichthys calabaricus]